MTRGYGITTADIDDGCPNDFKAYELAHNEEIREKDTMNYFMGLYNLSALSTIIAGITGKNAKYPEEPFMSKVEKTNNSTAEGREIIATIEMNQWMRRCAEQGLPQSPK